MATKIGSPHFNRKMKGPWFCAWRWSAARCVAVAAAFAKIAPQRVLWGSDWPHPTEQASNRIPNDALLLDLLSTAVPDEAARNRILVDNAATIYLFT